MSKAAAVNAELYAKAKAGITITVADGIPATIVEKGMFENNLPATVTKEQAKDYEEYRSEYFAATSKAFAETALPVFNEHKKIASISADFPLLGKDNWSVGIDRSKQFPNPQGGEPTTQFGAMSFKLETQAARGSRGVIKHVREEISAAALALLGGK